MMIRGTKTFENLVATQIYKSPEKCASFLIPCLPPSKALKENKIMAKEI
jgi:hypothetical protein